MCYLSVLFIHCSLYGIASWIMGTEKWRKAYVDKLVKTVEAAGCSFQKFGQWLSMRPDIFKADIIEGFRKLSQGAPTHEFEYTRKIIRESFKCEIEDIFESFEQEPIASGTVAQVYRARLKSQHALENGVRDVAVKVVHPQILPETFIDIDILYKFMHVVSYFDRSFAAPFKKEDFIEVVQK